MLQAREAVNKDKNWSCNKINLQNVLWNSLDMLVIINFRNGFLLPEADPRVWTEWSPNEKFSLTFKL